ncbi:MAG TPA: prepilin-type N-terminal cleavage/methylation domain-containing protein [Gemmatimonadales bacterium]|nr:prepilin-type N-terminal cleavage/methylation domain-containing protein [Gemmatimonadales bacterium]
MSNRKGFTVVEVLVATMVLGVGILALVGSSTVVTRMIGEGKRSMNATQLAQQRMETMRQTAMSTDPQCTNLNAQTGTATVGTTVVQWQVTVGVGTRTLLARAIYPDGRGVDTVTLNTILGCY